MFCCFLDLGFQMPHYTFFGYTTLTTDCLYSPNNLNLQNIYLKLRTTRFD